MNSTLRRILNEELKGSTNGILIRFLKMTMEEFRSTAQLVNKDPAVSNKLKRDWKKFEKALNDLTNTLRDEHPEADERWN